MPAKSKHSRRKISRRNPAANDLRNTAAAFADTNAAGPVYKITPPGSGLKTSLAEDASSANVLAEIKWIGIVTGIVIVVLVISYLFFR
jgi:hypothetical protein